jgi:hypothetical protein
MINRDRISQAIQPHTQPRKKAAFPETPPDHADSGNFDQELDVQRPQPPVRPSSTLERERIRYQYTSVIPSGEMSGLGKPTELQGTGSKSIQAALLILNQRNSLHIPTYFGEPQRLALSRHDGDDGLSDGTRRAKMDCKQSIVLSDCFPQVVQKERGAVVVFQRVTLDQRAGSPQHVPRQSRP